MIKIKSNEDIFEKFRLLASSYKSCLFGFAAVVQNDMIVDEEEAKEAIDEVIKIKAKLDKECEQLIHNLIFYIFTRCKNESKADHDQC